MELKSLIEKIMLINNTLGYSDNAEKLINKEYILKDNSQTLKELEILLVDSIKYSKSQELKLGLEIILLMISHKNENVRNAALTKMFVLLDDGLIRELVVKELKNESENGDKDSSESAEYSLDLIADEIHRFEVMDAVFDIFCRLKNMIALRFNQLGFLSVLSVYSHDKHNSLDISRTSIKNSVVHNNTLFNRLIRKLRALNRKIDRMVPYLEEIGNYDEIGYKETSCLNIQNSKSSENESLQKLANFYASTFTERGHLRRLISLLNDNDEDIQQVGVNALTDVVEILLKDSTEKISIKQLTGLDLEEISSFKK
ncbi:hypothetical protein [Methanobacterium sp.]|uniref:hypothetical protein n=1 Tax=Methanobacterium sp. TaxID=2164 RepID=UPI003C737D05